MSQPLRVLLVEDSEDDALLLLRELRRGGYTPTWERVDTPAAMEAALEGQAWDLVISDYNMPRFSGPAALSILQQRGLDLPLIMVSGVIGEETAVVAMQAGADDYLMKGSLARLTPAVRRALREAEHRRERKRAEAALRESEERYALAALGANDGLWDWHLASDQIYFSPRWKSMLGHEDFQIGDSPEEWFRRVHPADLERLRADIAAHLEGRSPHFENEHRMLHRDGAYHWMLTRGVAVRDAAGAAQRIAGSQTDITRRKQVEEQLVYDAFHDTLTGLPNRALFMDRLERLLTRARRHADYLFAVLWLDLDRFKIVNDSLGHLMGDQLLVEIAHRLQTCVRAGDTVARIGGDEFTLLLDDIRGTADAIRVADRIHDTLAEPFSLDGHEIYTTTSIGIALSASGYETAEDVLRDADTAMYRAKALGKARHVVFDAGMHARAVATLEIETDLRRAVEREELRLQYQPVVSLQTGAIVGFEALVRWHHPTRGMVPPGQFIPAAEDTGLIVPIGRWVLDQACRQMHGWRTRLPADSLIWMSVNLSSRQLAQMDLLDQVQETLRETGLDGRYLKLEITESTLMENIDSATVVLSDLRALGIQVSIDDFGTGYSSLSYLHRLPIDTLKVDRAFVTQIGAGQDSSEIARVVITLAHTLNMNVVAEGVETTEQLGALQFLGCEYAQGYLFSRPVDSDQATALLSLDAPCASEVAGYAWQSLIQTPSR
jgi:diguanylate cyclase (GGDEF)-like protein/PAS domain S-box-containing protein